MEVCVLGKRLDAAMRAVASSVHTRWRTLPRRLRRHEGQAVVETVMTTGFLVALALVLDKSLIPIVAKAFENIANALSSVGP